MTNPDQQPISQDRSIFDPKRALLRPGFPFASPRRWKAMMDDFSSRTPSQHTDAMHNDLITAARDAGIAGGLLAIPEPFVTKLIAAGFLAKVAIEVFPALFNYWESDFTFSGRPVFGGRRDTPTDTQEI